MKRIAVLALSVSALAAAGCRGDNPAEPQPTAADVHVALSTVGGVTAAPCFSDVRVQALVNDRRLRPVRNYLVNFRSLQGGGSVFAGSGLTGADGVARDVWTLGAPGPHVLEARSVDSATGDPLVHGTVNVVATVGSNASIEVRGASDHYVAYERSVHEFVAYDGCGASPGQPLREVPWVLTVWQDVSGEGTWLVLDRFNGQTTSEGTGNFTWQCTEVGLSHRLELVVGNAATGGEVTRSWSATCLNIG